MEQPAQRDTRGIEPPADPVRPGRRSIQQRRRQPLFKYGCNVPVDLIGKFLDCICCARARDDEIEVNAFGVPQVAMIEHHDSQPTAIQVLLFARCCDPFCA